MHVSLKEPCQSLIESFLKHYTIFDHRFKMRFNGGWYVYRPFVLRQRSE